MKEDYKSYFNNKKITIMGLGLLGRGIGDVKFLAECGADVLVTDIKTRKELLSSVKKLEGLKNVKFVLGKHRLEDFRNKDLIIKGAGVPLDSIFIKEALKEGIPVKMSTSLFVKFTEATVIGITGTRGKSTTTHLIHYILKKSGKRSYLGGNVRGLSTIALLKKAKKGDYVVLELDSWQLQGFSEEKISPHISVFTSFMPDHLNYYGGNLDLYFEDKANIFKFQKKNDFLITSESVFDLIRTKYKVNSRVVIADGNEISDWQDFKIFGEHNKKNVSFALNVAKTVGIKKEIALQAAKNFKGVPGRLEYIKSYKGVKFFNDTTATTPESSLAGLKSLNEKFKIKTIAIIGGNDKGIQTDFFVENLHNYSKVVILLPGTGTSKIESGVLSDNRLISFKSKNLKDAIKKAVKISKRGDIITLSPGFSSFGLFKNEFERGDKFNNLVSNLN